MLHRNLNSKPQEPPNRSQGSRAFTDRGADTYTGVSGRVYAVRRGVPGQGAVTHRGAMTCSTSAHTGVLEGCAEAVQTEGLQKDPSAGGLRGDKAASWGQTLESRSGHSCVTPLRGQGQQV